jgi:protein-disulfide isomerase
MNDKDTLTIEPEDTLTFKRSHLYAALLPLTFVIGLSVGYLFWGRGTGPSAASQPQVVVITQIAPQQENEAQAGAQPQPTAETAAEQAQNVKRYDVPEDDDPSIGPANAPITIIEFSDFECTFCQKWHAETWTQLVENYGDQIRLVYRDFPLTSIHGNATPAAAAANCAAEQNAYWEFHGKLFSNEYRLSKSTYEQYASDLSLDLEAFVECIDSGRHNDEVQADFEYASNLGVRSTPTFFVNGIPLVGAQPFEVFKDLIDKELAGEIP